jgi:Flp pilus assembly protein TadG
MNPSDPNAERGSASLELVVAFPAVLALIFGIVQGGLWYHARNVAALAAAEGLRATQAIDGSTSAGRVRAQSTLAHTGAEGFLSATSVSATRGPQEATVTVTGRAVGLFPAVKLDIRQSATGPVERLLEKP